MFTYKIDDEVSLKLLEKGDAWRLFEIVDSARAYFKKWIEWVDTIGDETDFYPKIEKYAQRYVMGERLKTGLLYQNQLIGIIGFNTMDKKNKRISLGYWIHEDYQGKGIVASSVPFFIQYAFESLKLNKVEIECVASNGKSRAIPENLGFTEEGTIRSALYLYSEY
ncbi:GNAT family protein [Bacillus sp. 165]|uniref:GNAT family N-acetyltransferase n=1 Tax=Bacillus sp. 165 TaxID=1529117 RepID=UPI001ADC411D|nr:GNAT family protein [Bacillus sp. 165]MBO9129893.1 GNAT family N-acetyltransferase [Bacillus sp. 165]